MCSTGPDLCCREASLWNLLLEPSVKGVGIDVNLPPSTGHPLPGPPISQEGPQGPFSGRDLLPSNIYFSSNASRIFGEMLWAERMQTGAAGVDALIHFSTFDWRLCGELIGHPLSSAWEAVVDLRWGTVKTFAAFYPYMRGVLTQQHACAIH